MKKKILFGLGALAILVMLQINVNLAANSQKSDITLNRMAKIAKADGECPVNPIPWHCSFMFMYDHCVFTDLCIITCPEPCCYFPGC